jgi:hypothetical protein
MDRREIEMVMDRLYGSPNARNAQGLGHGGEAINDDQRRRRAGLGSGFAATSGGLASLMDVMPHLQGMRGYDYSGPTRGGLAGLLQGGGRESALEGPVARHFANMGGRPELDPGFTPPGFDQGAQMEGFVPPGFDNRNPVGGPNVAPGAPGAGTALNQPAQAVRNQAGLDALHGQGWRNVAPGYSAAAQFGYGTPEFARRLAGLQGGPAGGAQAPGAMGAASTGGGGGERGGPGGGGGGPAPTAMTPAAEPTSTLRTAGAPAGGGGAGAPAQHGGGGGGGGGGRNQVGGRPVGKGEQTSGEYHPKGSPKGFTIRGNKAYQDGAPVTYGPPSAGTGALAKPTLKKPLGNVSTNKFVGPVKPSRFKGGPGVGGRNQTPAPEPKAPMASTSPQGNQTPSPEIKAVMASTAAPAPTTTKGKTKPKPKQIGGRIVT